MCAGGELRLTASPLDTADRQTKAVILDVFMLNAAAAIALVAHYQPETAAASAVIIALLNCSYEQFTV